MRLLINIKKHIMNSGHITKKDLTEELGKFTGIIVGRIDDVAIRVDRCEAGIENLNDKFEHAAYL